MQQLGRYEILEQIGAGSMGVVYRARDTVLDRETALKTIRTGSEVDPEVRERFYREARACARLRHTSVVTIYDLGEIDRVAYIAMELLRGRDLRKIIQEQAEVPLARKIEVMAECCEALAHAHASQVVHRDIKPSNIMLTEGGPAKVLDFGIARLATSQLTVLGRVLGTPNYMSPEQIHGEPCDARSDLFSAAVVFFELLVYRHPFHAAVIPRRIVDAAPDSLFDHDPKLPYQLEEILARAMSKDRRARYQSGDEFAADLRRVLREPGPAIAARIIDVPPTMPEQAPVEDFKEWRFVEATRLIPQLEGAVARKELVLAQSYFTELESIGKEDSRLNDSVQFWRDRISGLLEGGATGTGNGKACPACGGQNRPGAAFCLECGERLEDPKPQPRRRVVRMMEPDTIKPENIWTHWGREIGRMWGEWVGKLRKP